MMMKMEFSITMMLAQGPVGWVSPPGNDENQMMKTSILMEMAMWTSWINALQ